MSATLKPCPDCCSSPQVAVSASVLITQNDDLNKQAQVSTQNATYQSNLQAMQPGRTQQQKSQTERLQALNARLRLGQCQ